MYLQIATLFLSTMSSGLLIFILPRFPQKILQYIIAFGGSYLFSLTLSHMLPELFEQATKRSISVVPFLLFGFFFQLLLDPVGGCVVHGHLHQPYTAHAFNIPSLTLTGALLLHAFLEGVLLDEHLSQRSFAILLHKLPAAFIFTATLYHRKHAKESILLALFLFSLSTPASYLAINYFQNNIWLTPKNIISLQAIAIGNLFHIATSILFETSSCHQQLSHKWAPLLAGTCLPLLFEYCIPHH